MRALNILSAALALACSLSCLRAEEAKMIPAQRAVKPGPPMERGSSVGSPEQNRVLKELGFDLLQTDSDHLTVNQTAPGVWDWTAADAGYAAAKAVGAKWQYFPHFHWAPEWLQKTDRFVPSVCLGHGKEITAMSLWSPYLLPWFEECYAALAKHYSHGEISAIYLGIHGDFGETIFPMGWHPDEKKRPVGGVHPDYWCGDKYARADFRKQMKKKYGSLDKLNTAWGMKLTSFEEIAYPSTDGILASAGSRRRWLDFITWYYDSMTEFTRKVAAIARKHFPQATLMLPIGGGEEALVYGQDNSGVVKICRESGVHARSTHGGFQPYAANYGSMLNRIASAARFYKVPLWIEPPGGISPEGEVQRIFEALSCGAHGFWDWGSNPVGAADTFRKYGSFLTQEKSVIDVALWYPMVDHRLHPEVGFPRRFHEAATKLRDLVDYGIVDDRMIADGALKDYKMLVYLEGEYAERATFEQIERYVKDGGVFVSYGPGMKTLEGEKGPWEQITGRGKGWVAHFRYDWKKPDLYCNFVRDAVYGRRYLRTKLAERVDDNPDDVYASHFANGEAIFYNPQHGPVTRQVFRRDLTLAPISLTSFAVPKQGK